MNKENIRQYNMDEEREKELWDSSTFIFDSSALLDFYFFPKKTREKIYSETFAPLIKRLWAPAHVEFEFLKNRENVILKPIIEQYKPLEEKVKSIKSNYIKDVKSKIKEISDLTSKEKRHPHIEQNKINDVKTKIDAFEATLNEFEEEILKQIIGAEDEVESVKDNDDLLDALNKYMEIGKEYSFEMIMKIIEEGKLRYAYKIPPGYGDLNSGNKKGTQIFGDLIIWKQILDYSKENGSNIIFITNDTKKDEDWCYINRSGRVEAPREELIKEFKDNSGGEFWIYNLPQFLHFSNKYLEASISPKTIQDITKFINTKKNNRVLRFKCDECDKIHDYNASEINLYFEPIYNKATSTAQDYQAKKDFSCNCGNNISVVFELYESYKKISSNIRLNGAKLIGSFYFTKDMFESPYIVCEACTGNKEGYGNMVFMDSFWDLDNKYDNQHENHKYTSAEIGRCDWCNTLHVRCPKCGEVNCFSDHDLEENKECEGGCDLIFRLEDDSEIGGYELKLIDSLKVTCEYCGDEFIDLDGRSSICENCEGDFNMK
ncbi:PIN-like domain-containing protein [Elizabethkingia meningoseptica]|uniref:PIN-like domain-containing protein n=1 Tax=Elizabethkingia meningoseptica TaxID=238 RepID=UPI00093599EE|nr:PIN domain-containing protein [Elizabethkingia meningoseptica]